MSGILTLRFWAGKRKKIKISTDDTDDTDDDFAISGAVTDDALDFFICGICDICG